MAIVILNEGNVILSEATAILNLFQDMSLVDKIPNQVSSDILKNTPPSPYQGEGLGVRLICHPKPKVKIINVCDREWDSSDTACPFRMTK